MTNQINGLKAGQIYYINSDVRGMCNAQVSLDQTGLLKNKPVQKYDGAIALQPQRKNRHCLFVLIFLSLSSVVLSHSQCYCSCRNKNTKIISQLSSSKISSLAQN
jgi:hypothetical protein